MNSRASAMVNEWAKASRRADAASAGGGAGEPAGRHEEGSPERLGDGLLVAAAEAEAGGPAQQVVGQGGGQQPGRVGGEPGRQDQASASLRRNSSASSVTLCACTSSPAVQMWALWF